MPEKKTPAPPVEKTPDDLLAESAKAYAAEWDIYVAAVPIDIDGIRAFNPGAAVPVSHVEKFSLQDSVELRVNGAAPEPSVETPPASPDGA